MEIRILLKMGIREGLTYARESIERTKDQFDELQVYTNC